jgi:hypothetical protein
MVKRKLTRYDLIHVFRLDYKNLIEATPKDYPALRQAWIDMVDSYIKDGSVPPQAGNWDKPSFVEPREQNRSEYITADIYPNRPTISVRKGKKLLFQVKGNEASAILLEYYSLGKRPDLVTYLKEKGYFDVY